MSPPPTGNPRSTTGKHVALRLITMDDFCITYSITLLTVSGYILKYLHVRHYEVIEILYSINCSHEYVHRWKMSQLNRHCVEIDIHHDWPCYHYQWDDILTYIYILLYGFILILPLISRLAMGKWGQSREGDKGFFGVLFIPWQCSEHCFILTLTIYHRCDQMYYVSWACRMWVIWNESLLARSLFILWFVQIAEAFLWKINWHSC